MWRVTVTLLLCVVGSSGCLDNPPSAEVYDLDLDFYRCRVQPIVDRSCAALACHGQARRPFHSFSRNRMRIVGDNLNRNLPLSMDELLANYDSARAFATATPAESLLLLKPLDDEAGGYYHRGKQIFARGDVFRDTSDPGYQVIATWLGGATESTDCIYPGTEP